MVLTESGGVSMDKDARIILWKIWAFLSLLTAGFSFFFAVIGILSFLKHPQPGDLPAIILLAAAGAIFFWTFQRTRKSLSRLQSRQD